jgi:FlaG protein
MELTPLQPGGVDPVTAQARAERARQKAPAGAEFKPPVAQTETPEWPPPSVWREVDHASRVWESLRAQGRELHFEHDEKSGRVVIQVRDLDGNVLRTVPPSEAVSIASGSPA